MKYKTKKAERSDNQQGRKRNKRRKVKVFDLTQVRKPVAKAYSVEARDRIPRRTKPTKLKLTKQTSSNGCRVYHSQKLLNLIRLEFEFIVKRLSLSEQEIQKRQKTLNRLKDYFKPMGLEMCVYGSFYTRLSLPSSDLDITVYPSTYTNTDRLLSTIAFQLRSRSILKPGSLRIIRFARVPIVKFIESSSDLNIDISISQDSGLEGTSLVEGILAENPKLANVILFLKLLLRQYGLNDASVGGVSSFLLFHMVYSFFRLKYTQGGFDSAEFLVGFFLFYSEFDYRRFGIRTENIESDDYSLGTNAYFVKRERFPNSPEENLSIENLLKASQDVGTASREFSNVKRLFGLCIQKFNSYALGLSEGLFLNSSNSIMKYDSDLSAGEDLECGLDRHH